MSKGRQSSLSSASYLSKATCSFNVADVALEGEYSDELATFRAKKRWKQGFQASFLLEDNYDFSMVVTQSPDTLLFKLRCFFSTACGRYAFWRLTHHQVPELLYLIETAHIPDSGEGLLSIGFATDLQELDSKKSYESLEGSEMGPMNSLLENVIDQCKSAISVFTSLKEPGRRVKKTRIKVKSKKAISDSYNDSPAK